MLSTSQKQMSHYQARRHKCVTRDDKNTFATKQSCIHILQAKWYFGIHCYQLTVSWNLDYDTSRVSQS
jgi:hypothetical protein